MDSDIGLAEALGIESGISVLTLTQVYVLAAVALTLLSQFWTGLSACLTTLDVDQLEILVDTSDKDATSARLGRCAQQILPLRRRGRVLLCTLLVVGTATRSLLALVLHEAVGPLRAWLLVSVGLFLLSELVPQVLNSFAGLRVGASGAPVAWAALALLYPLTKPLALALDCVFPQGDKVLGRAQLRAFCESATVPGMLVKGQAEMMIGALAVAHSTVGAVMVPMEKVFKLGFDEPLDYQLLSTLVRKGFTRAPVMNPRTGQIEGILHCKELLAQRFGQCGVLPKGAAKSEGEGSGNGTHGGTAKQTAGDFLIALRKAGKESRVYVCGKNTRLCTLLYEFKTASHVAVVADVDEPGGVAIDGRTGLPGKHIGIITLHNLFEVILQMSEGFQESVNKADMAITMQLLNAPCLNSLVAEKGFLTSTQAEAVAGFLQSTVSVFHPRHVRPATLRRLLQCLPILRLRVDTLLYKRNREATYSVLILQGEAAVSCSEDGIEGTVGPWHFLGAGALRQMLALHTGLRYMDLDSPSRPYNGSTATREASEDDYPVYTPDFTAKVRSQGFLVLRVDKQQFLEVLRCPSEVGDCTDGRRISVFSSMSAFSAQSSGCQEESQPKSPIDAPEQREWAVEPEGFFGNADGAAPRLPPISPCPPLLTAQPDSAD